MNETVAGEESGWFRAAKYEMCYLNSYTSVCIVNVYDDCAK